MKFIGRLLSIMFIVDVALLFSETLRTEGTVYGHFLKIILLFFGVGALVLLFKKYIYFHYFEEVRVVHLNIKSDYIDDLLFKVIAICLVGLLNIYLFNDVFYHRHTIQLIICTTLASLAILLNARPALLLNPSGFYFDDYYPDEWKWKDIQQIHFGEDHIYLKGRFQDFELPLSYLDTEDFKTPWWQPQFDIAANYSREDFQKWLHSYALAHQIDCNTPEFLKTKKELL